LAGGFVCCAIPGKLGFFQGNAKGKNWLFLKAFCAPNLQKPFIFLQPAAKAG